MCGAITNYMYYPFGLSYRLHDGGQSNRYLYNGKEQESFNKLYWNDYSARFYDSQLGRWHVTDPADQFHSPYVYCANNPLNATDPDGCEMTDFINLENGKTVHVEDGVNEVRFVNDKDFTRIESLSNTAMNNWSSKDAVFYKNICASSATLDWNSYLGKMIRVVFAEMKSVGNTNTDRRVVAESITNRYKSGEFGENYDDVLTPGQYNAMRTKVYKFGPYSYIQSQEGNISTRNMQKLQSNFLNAVSVSYRAMFGIGAMLDCMPFSYVSFPKTAQAFDGNHRLQNVTNQISGLRGVSGVWKLK
ncbi:MAG: RHS repeat-associated core domain-containing protein [Ignavibacteria bacterium]|nr:RHS repeat-associated core domain-containing protein [Ignavibacteria bacterium]